MYRERDSGAPEVRDERERGIEQRGREGEGGDAVGRGRIKDDEKEKER